MLVQEHKLRTADEMATTEDVAHKERCRIRWSPALDSPCGTGCPIAGVAILVKVGCGLSSAPGSPCNVFDGFVAAGYLELHGSLPSSACSVYLECGLGLEGRNIEILKSLGLHIMGR